MPNASSAAPAKSCLSSSDREAAHEDLHQATHQAPPGLKARLAARFFHYVQQAPFYREVHRQAVACLPRASAADGAAATWVDHGCGPGLVALLAAERGYQVLGRDINGAAVALANVQARQQALPARFEQAGFADSLPEPGGVQVVSAASLLFVLDEPRAALDTLLGQLRPGGAVLLIETTEALRPTTAWAWLRRHGFGPRWGVLLLWSLVRRGKALRPDQWSLPGWQLSQHPLMDGLVTAWVIRRSGQSQGEEPV